MIDEVAEKAGVANMAGLLLHGFEVGGLNSILVFSVEYFYLCVPGARSVPLAASRWLHRNHLEP